MNKKFFKNYFRTMGAALLEVEESSLFKAVELINKTNQSDGKILLFGNGGSAGIASHLAVDFTKAAGIRAMTYTDPSVVTCFANDYGYEKWVDQALQFYARTQDTAILISSSGSSENIVNGALRAKQMGLNVITLSGFDPNNKLRGSGDVNFWLDSDDYNVVEMTHHIWLLAIVDFIIESKL
ncbi:MAG: SIS domain-containing protein [Pseudomonadota bacterium]|nr:SIS domain-containing protein [Pseudomonadota bacterium]